MKPEKMIQLRPDETLLAVIREHTVPYVPWMVFLFVWIVTPFFFLFPLFRQGPIGVGIFFALVFSGAFVAWRKYFAWQHTVFVITDQRVVDVSQRGFFDRTHAEAAYADVEDVAYRIKGLVPTIFRYGTIQVKTVGNAADLEMRHVKNPAKYHDLLQEVRAEAAVSVPKTLKSRKVKELLSQLSEEEVDALMARKRQEDQEAAVRDFSAPR